MYATCCDCGEDFWRGDDETWKVRCLDCWKADKAAKESARHEDRAANKSTHANHTNEKALLEAYWRGWNAHRELAESEPSPTFDKTRIRELLQLCHPDKHAGSALAAKVTQWLNEIKRGVPA